MEKIRKYVETAKVLFLILICSIIVILLLSSIYFKQNYQKDSSEIEDFLPTSENCTDFFGKLYTLTYPQIILRNDSFFCAYSRDINGDGNDDTFLRMIDKRNVLSEEFFIGYGRGDTHGHPAIWIDKTGILHIFYGCHNSEIFYKRTKHPFCLTSWINATLPHCRGTYLKIIENETNVIFLFFRNYTVVNTFNGSSFAYVYTEDDGISWSNVIDFCNYGPGFAVYPAAVVYYDKVLHVCWTMYDLSLNQRYNFYYARSKTDGATWENIKGIPLGIFINKTESEKYCIAYNSRDDPAVLYGENYTASAQAYDMVIYNNSPVIIGNANNTRYVLTLWDGEKWETQKISDAEFTMTVNAHAQLLQCDGNLQCYVLVDNGTDDKYDFYGDLCLYMKSSDGWSKKYITTSGQVTTIQKTLDDSTVFFTENDKIKWIRRCEINS